MAPTSYSWFISYNIRIFTSIPVTVNWLDPFLIVVGQCNILWKSHIFFICSLNLSEFGCFRLWKLVKVSFLLLCVHCAFFLLFSLSIISILYCPTHQLICQPLFSQLKRWKAKCHFLSILTNMIPFFKIEKHKML